MPGIMQLKQNFKGGGADMGARDRAQERADRGYGDTSGPDDKGTAEQNRNQRNIVAAAQREKRIKDFKKNLPKNFTQKYGPKLLNTALLSLVPMPLRIAYTAYQNYPKVAANINTLYGTNIPTYSPKSVTDIRDLLTSNSTTTGDDDDERIFGDNNLTIPPGILTQQPQMFSNMPMIDVPREDPYPFLSAADFDIDPQYREYGIGNLYG